MIFLFTALAALLSSQLAGESVPILLIPGLQSLPRMLPPECRGECARLGRGGRGPGVRGEEARDQGPGGHQHHLAQGHREARGRAGDHRPQ